MNILRDSVKWCAALAVLGLVACGSKSNENSDSGVAVDTNVETAVAVADTEQTEEEPIIEEKDTEEEDIKLITEFYKKYALTRSASKAQLQKYCTAACIKKLAAAYEYDGGGYALWDMTTGEQDGDGATKVNGVEAKGDGWYRVSYIEMGIKGVTDVQIVDGKINNYKTVR